MSGLALIGVTSLMGMLKKEVSFLSWLIVIWEKVVKENALMKNFGKLGESGQRKCSYEMIAHRKLRFQLRFIEARKRLASVRWLEMGCC